MAVILNNADARRNITHLLYRDLLNNALRELARQLDRFPHDDRTPLQYGKQASDWAGE